jgi:hypothetical protein
MVANIFDLAGKRIYVAGHRGTVGCAIVRARKAGVKVHDQSTGLPSSPSYLCPRNSRQPLRTIVSHGAR